MERNWYRIMGVRGDPSNERSSVLVYGAGPLGSLFAARLQQGGNHVSLLARGQRLADLCEHGIVLEDVRTGEFTVTQVYLIEQLGPDDAPRLQNTYDLVLVVMRKNCVHDVLPVLAANRYTPNILFLGNNAAGPDAYVEALGRERVLIGFPNTAGYRDGHIVHCLAGTEQDPTSVPFGEVDGRISWRTRQVARILDSALGLKAELRTDMDAWLKYHVALLFPSLAPALYAAGTDRLRLARTRDLLVLTIRATREGLRVLRALGYPITPARFRSILWIPEPILVLLLRSLLQNDLMEVALVRHAEVIRDEVRQLTDEFIALARRSSVPTPTIDRLYPHIDPRTPTVPDGRARIPMRWGRLSLCLGALVSLLVSGLILARRLNRSRWHRNRVRKRSGTAPRLDRPNGGIKHQ
jgi:2-dehydropantoate 2-reductase